MTIPINQPEPYHVDILSNLSLAIEIIESKKKRSHRDVKAVAGLRLAAEQVAALVDACRTTRMVLAEIPILDTDEEIEDVRISTMELCEKAILDAGAAL